MENPAQPVPSGERFGACSHATSFPLLTDSDAKLTDVSDPGEAVGASGQDERDPATATPFVDPATVIMDTGSRPSVPRQHGLKRSRVRSTDREEHIVKDEELARRIVEQKVWVKAGPPATSHVQHPASKTAQEGDVVLLIREHDRVGYPNAIRVVTSSLIVSERSVGFVDERSADVLAPLLDQGADVVRAVLAHLHASSYVGRRLNVMLSTTSDV